VRQELAGVGEADVARLADERNALVVLQDLIRLEQVVAFLTFDRLKVSIIKNLLDTRNF
jgi:hypothetical protein